MAASPYIGPGTLPASNGTVRGANRNALLIVPAPQRPKRNPSLVPFLSIQLLILAFFIILTSQSSWDKEKSRAITESVQRQFSGKQVMVPDGPQGRALEPDAADVLQSIMIKFQGLVPLDSSVRRLSALEQTIKLPVDLFFAPDSADVLASRRGLIDEVMRAIDLRPAGWGYELEILVQGAPPGPITLDRAANLAAALSGDGRGQSGIVVALGAGDPAWLVLMIRMRPNNPAATELPGGGEGQP